MRTIISLLFFLHTFLALPAFAYEVSTSARVVAFADVHGAYDDWVALLQEVGVVDEELNWSGGNTHLVSVGDLVDRGPGSRAVVELMMKLDGQAEAAGGAVHMTLGNHEVMVMTGDLRYVSAEEFAAFADDESEQEREHFYQQYRQYNSGGDDATVRSEERRYSRRPGRENPGRDQCSDAG